MFPFVQARWYLHGRPLSPSLIVIHTMEDPEKGGTAKAVAEYFRTKKAPGASAHYCVDDRVIIQCVRETDQAAGAPGANTQGIHVEHAGYARQSAADWDDPYSRSMLQLSARLTAEIAERWAIPVVWLTPEDLKAGKRGFTSHANVSSAWHKSTHTDPGPHFPVGRYLQWVREDLDGRQDVAVTLDGKALPVTAYVEAGKSWVGLRRLAAFLNIEFALEKGRVELKKGAISFLAPFRIESVVGQPVGYIPLGELVHLGYGVEWQRVARVVALTGGAESEEGC